MATLPISNNQFNTTVTLSKRTSNIFTFNTRNTFVDKNIRLRVDVQSASVMLSATANATVNSVEQFFDADSDTFKINGTGTLRGTATLSVQRAGWLAATTNRVPVSNTLYLDDLIELPKIQLSTTFTSASGAVKPIIETNNLAGNFIDAASGSATTATPTTGVYVAVQSQADTTTITARPIVTAEGYGTSTQGEYSYTTASANVGATASDITYIPITLGEISADSASAGVNLYTIDGTNAGTNISNIVGTKNSQEPTTGYYLAFQADATGGSRVTRAGWVNEGVLAPATGASIQYFPISIATMSITGGNLIAGSGYSSLQNKGYYDGTSYNVSDKIDITSQTSPAEGYYVLEAHGSGTVNRAAINRQVMQAGYAPADAQEVVAQEAINNFASATAINNYYIKKSTLSTTSITSSFVNQDITISEGYYPSPRTITVQGMTATTVTTSYSFEGFTTYFTEGTSTDSNISITPLFSNEAGFISQHINANNGGTGYWKIINTSTTYTAATVDNTTFSQGRAQWGTGWITSGNIGGASFNNTPNAYVNYLDISDTTGAPIIPEGGYLYINKGYTDNVRISLAKLIPNNATITANPDSTTSGQMLSGYSAYNNEGTLLVGSIPTKGREDIGINGQTITIPSGYYAQPISQSVQGGEIKSGAATAVLSDPYYNIDNNNFTINATGTVALPIVTREGYVSSAGTAGKTGNTVSGTGSLNLIGLSTTSTGDLITTPVIQRTVKPAVDTWVDAANGAATTVKPTSGAYVQVDANANTSTVAIRSIVTSAGYGTTDHYAVTTDSYVVGAAKAQTRYIPIKMASITSTAPTLSVTAMAGTINITRQPSVSATVTSTMTGIDGGYYTDNSTSPYAITFSASATANGATIEATGGTAEATVSESQVSITEGYNTTPTTVVNTAITNSQTGSTTTITVDTVSKNVNTTIYLKPAVISITGGELTASTGYGDLTSSGYYNGSSYDTGDKVMITTTQASGYYKLIASGYGTVSRAAITQQVTTAGYMPATTQTNYSNATSLNSNTGSTNYYIKKSTLSIQDNISNGNALLVQSGSSDETVTISAGYYPSDRTITIQKIDDMAEGTVNTGLNNTGLNTYFNITTESGDVSLTPYYINTEGYIAEHNTAQDGATSYYNIKTASGYSLSVSSIAGSDTVTVGTLSSGYYPIIANNLSVTATLTASTPGWFSSGSATDSDTDNVTVGKMAAATISGASINANASISVTPGVLTVSSNTKSISGKVRVTSTPTTSTPTEKYYISIKTNVAASSNYKGLITGSGTAIVGTAGYAPNTLTGAVTVSGTATASSTSASNSNYILPINAGSLTASVAVTAGNATMTATGFTALTGTTTSSYYVVLSTSSGSATPTVRVSTSGYVTSDENVTISATSIGVAGNGNRLYIPNGSVTASTTYSSPKATATMASSTSLPTTSSGSFYVNLSITTANGFARGKATAISTGMITQNQNWFATSAVVAPSVNAPVTRIYIPAATVANAASVYSQPVVTAVMSTTGMVTQSTSSKYAITVTATRSSGTIYARATATLAGIVTLNQNWSSNTAVTATVGYSTTRINIPASTMTTGVSNTTANLTIINTNPRLGMYTSDSTTTINGYSYGFIPMTFVASTCSTVATTATAGYTTTANSSINVPTTATITRYIGSVTLPVGCHFTIYVPNGSSSSYIGFRFSASTNGSVYVDSP